MGKYRKFSAAIKARIAIEAIKGQRTVQEIASSYNLGEFFRRTRRKLGIPEAVTATAHKLARTLSRFSERKRLRTKACFCVRTRK